MDSWDSVIFVMRRDRTRAEARRTVSLMLEDVVRHTCSRADPFCSEPPAPAVMEAKPVL